MESVIRPMRVYQMQGGTETLVKVVSADEMREILHNQKFNVGFNGRKSTKPSKSRIAPRERKPKEKKPKVFTRTCAHCGCEFQQTTGRKASWCHECRKLPHSVRYGGKHERL